MSSDFEWKRTDECLPLRGERIIVNLHMVARNGESCDFQFFAKHVGRGVFVPLAKPNFFEEQNVKEARHKVVSHWARIPMLSEGERDRFWKEDEKWR